MGGITLDGFLELARDNYGTEPEYLWEGFPDTGVLRHASNRKWYAVFMNVAREKLGLSGGGSVDIAVVKCDPMMLGSMLMQEGFLRAYHMNKSKWITLLLDGTLSQEQALAALEMSYELTKPKVKRIKNV